MTRREILERLIELPDDELDADVGEYDILAATPGDPRRLALDLERLERDLRDLDGQPISLDRPALTVAVELDSLRMRIGQCHAWLAVWHELMAAGMDRYRSPDFSGIGRAVGFIRHLRERADAADAAIT